MTAKYVGGSGSVVVNLQGEVVGMLTHAGSLDAATAIELEPINNLSRYSRGVAKLNLGEYDFSSAHGQRRDSRPERQAR